MNKGSQRPFGVTLVRVPCVAPWAKTRRSRSAGVPFDRNAYAIDSRLRRETRLQRWLTVRGWRSLRRLAWTRGQGGQGRLGRGVHESFRIAISSKGDFKMWLVNMERQSPRDAGNTRVGAHSENFASLNHL